MEIRGKAGDDDPLLRPHEDGPERPAHHRLGRSAAGSFGVGGVGQHEVDPVAANLREGLQICSAAVDRRLVELEVAGVEDAPVARIHNDRDGVRDGMRDRQKAAVERADPATARRLDLHQLRTDAVLVEAPAGDTEGEGVPKTGTSNSRRNHESAPT